MQYSAKSTVLETLTDFKGFKAGDYLLPLGIALLFYSSIVFAGGYYADDLDRAYYGNFSWLGVGRPIAQAVALFYSFSGSLENFFILDPFPISIVIIAVLVCLSSLLVRLSLSRYDTDLALPLSILYIVNPFQLQNALYHYDSIGMFLAPLFVCLAFYTDTKKGSFSVKVILLFFCLNAYQPFINLYAGLIAVRLMLQIKSENVVSVRQSIAAVTKAIWPMLVSCIFYFSLVRILLPSSDNPRTNILSFDWSLPQKMIVNYFEAAHVFIEFWQVYWLFALPILPLLVWGLLRIVSNRTNAIPLSSVLSLLLFSTLGFMAILNQQFFEPRGLVYFPVLMMVAYIVLAMTTQKIGWVMIIPILACFLFSARVGNIQNVQDRFETPIFAMAVADIYSISDDYKVISIGSIALNPTASAIARHTPFHGFLQRGSWQTGGRLLHQGAEKLEFQFSAAYRPSLAQFKSEVEKDEYLTLVRKPYYEIYSKDNTLWIKWL